MDKVKHCPNCGKRGELMHIWVHWNRKIRKYHVECPNCHWCGKSMPFVWLAELAWNLQRRG